VSQLPSSPAQYAATDADVQFAIRGTQFLNAVRRTAPLSWIALTSSWILVAGAFAWVGYDGSTQAFYPWADVLGPVYMLTYLFPTMYFGPRLLRRPWIAFFGRRCGLSTSEARRLWRVYDDARRALSWSPERLSQDIGRYGFDVVENGVVHAADEWDRENVG
jgi:hypothetical protein